MTVFGYARVSTPAQELDIQIDELKAAGCEVLFFEKESGMKHDRRMFNRLLKKIRSGDVVIVPAFDRLTRIGPFRLLSVLHEIEERGAVCKSLAQPWIKPTDGLSELFAALQGYFDHRVWDDIMRRTRAGRERARANGVKFGRKPKLTLEQRREVLGRKLSGEPQSHIARAFQVSPSTISRVKRA
ncbi:recombinase family protein [Bradyrhizobium sp. LB11.1]|uniref:recombinase family protein n=1 Tax=Bradyrhizobium sp. LB11.1 TaxID=3156326 RepID=UPI003398E468